MIGVASAFPGLRRGSPAWTAAVPMPRWRDCGGSVVPGAAS